MKGKEETGRGREVRQGKTEWFNSSQQEGKKKRRNEEKEEGNM